MFKCAVTGRMSRPGEKLNRIVIQTREKVYTQKVWEDGELVDIEIGRGYETVREINATDAGVELYNQMVANGTVESFLTKFQ